MFCTVVIPTIGRTSLSRSVQSVLDQTFTGDDFEVIVVNDSGEALPYFDWQHSNRVTIIDTFQHERSVARNVGAAAARGKYLYFLDDDDWLAPEALQSFWELAQGGNAGWLYGTSQLVDRQHTPLIQLKHGLTGNAFLPSMAGEWIPLQASLVKSEIFFEVGGFNPHLSITEDIDLLRRITLSSDIAETPDLVAYVVMGELGSTTDHSAHHRSSRWAREKILESPKTFPRLQEKANTDYWHGRLSRIYLTSSIWNLQNKRLTISLSRVLSTIRTLFLSPSSLFSTGYWAALTKPYQSETFARGIEEAHEPPVLR